MTTTNTIFFTVTILISGCSLAISLYLIYIQPLKRKETQRYINFLIKFHIEQYFSKREAEYLKQKTGYLTAEQSASGANNLLPNNSEQPTPETLYSFMMTHYPEFISKLNKHIPTSLPYAEEQTCFLIKLGLKNERIAECMSVTVGSVVKNKQRLRRRLTDLPEDAKLVLWIQQLGEPLDKLPPVDVMFIKKGRRNYY